MISHQQSRPLDHDEAAEMINDIAVAKAKFREISEILADDGVWILEQSYMPTMIDEAEYDTVCHEHLEYYGLRQIKWMADRVGLKIAGVEFNDINGGSFSVTLSKKALAPSYALSGKANPESSADFNTITAKPVTEIAYETGFSDPKLFHRNFKKISNLSPGEYRTKSSN